ncbi:MAG: hypothetical protein ACYS8K_06690 [Planctomycetota bacterium]|jgi:hypothetical protein
MRGYRLGYFREYEEDEGAEAADDERPEQPVDAVKRLRLALYILRIENGLPLFDERQPAPSRRPDGDSQAEI